MKNKKYLFIVIGIILLISLIIILYFNPIIILRNKKNVVISLNETYKDSGYVFIGFNKKKLKINDNIDSSKPGSYEMTYKYGNKKIKRKIEVVDNIPPEIKLKGDNPAFVCNYDLYQEEGYELLDNYDSLDNIKIDIKKDNNKIIYEAKDASGNNFKIIRELIIKDDEKPVINLTGGKNITITKGETYRDKYTATDNCDGDITKEVKVIGNVDTKKIGAYELNYEVSDKKGNKQVATRKVTVKEKQMYTGSTIYLTFDDGPSKDVTPYILDLLKKYNIKATFFVVGTNNNDNLIKRAYDEGHTIGLHSYTHKYSIYKSTDDYFNDLNKISDKVYKITGYRSNIIRFPGGSSNTVSRNYKKGIMTTLADEVTERGYIYFDWNVGSSDTSTNSATKVCNNVKNRLGYGTNVVLMHDYSGKTSNIEALECIIKYGIDRGYSFDKITENTKVIQHKVAN